MTNAPPPPLRSLVKPGVSRRTDFALCPSSMALLVIDIQRELTTIEESSKEYKDAISFPRMITNTKHLIEAVRATRSADVNEQGSEIIFTYLEALTDNSRDVSLDYKLSGPGLSNLPGPSSPASLLPGIAPIKGREISLPKTSCSVFQSTNLNYILRNLNVEQLVVCGQLTDQCVESAVRDAADLGYFVTVVEDACGANSEDSHQKGFHGMQGFARIVKTEQVLKELNDPLLQKEFIHKAKIDAINKQDAAKGEPGAPAGEDNVLTIPNSKAYTNKGEGSHAAILRSLRAARVKFIRYAIVDAYNTMRCKIVPLSQAMGQLQNGNSSPLDNPVSIAEVCFAGLPTHADVPVPSSNLTAKNVLTLHPDLSSLRILPYAPNSAMMMCTAHNQQTRELSPLCTRGLLERVLSEARKSMGLEFAVGAELEFQLFHADAADGVPHPVDNSTFANTLSLNEQDNFINEVYDQLIDQDIEVELIHSESAPGQIEIVIKHSTNVTAVADSVVMSRETITACAKKHGMKALFLPKTSMMTAGNGLHLHFSLCDVGSSSNAFPDPSQPTGISTRGGSFIEGVLGHLPSLLSFSLPTNNSFRRMGKGCWTGSTLGWSTEDKEVPIRVCIDLNTQEATNVELKLSDGTANIYLELAMILAAGMDGIKSNKTLRPMMTDDTAEPLPETLQESLDVLKENEVLLSVLGEQLSTAYIAVREAEAQMEKLFKEELKDAFNRA